MGKLQLWSPVGDLLDFSSKMEDLLGEFGMNRRSTASETNMWCPSVDIHEDKEAVTIAADLPGLKREDVKLSVEDGVLTIRGERKLEKSDCKGDYCRIERSYGNFSRSFTLPQTISADKITAEMKDGELRVMLPKREEAKPKQIAINVS